MDAKVFEPTVGIYFLYRDSELLYIGQATDCEYRIRQHKSKGFNRYRFEPCKKDELLTKEREAITLYKPKLNKAKYDGGISDRERQRRWIEKNRALHNLRRRNARKQNFPVSGGNTVRTERSGALAGDAPKSGAPHTVESLRAMIQTEQESPVEPPVKPVVYRDDYGRPISEHQWNQLQEAKRKAKEAGYTLDEFTQI